MDRTCAGHTADAKNMIWSENGEFNVSRAYTVLTNLIRHVIAMPGDHIERREILFSSKQLTAELLNNSVIRP